MIYSSLIGLITGIAWIVLLLWHRKVIKELIEKQEECQESCREWERRIWMLELISKKFHPHHGITLPPPPPPIDCLKRKGI